MIKELLESHLFPIYYLLILIMMIMAGIFFSKKLKIDETELSKPRTMVGFIVSFFSLLLAFMLSSSSQSNKHRSSVMNQHAEAIENLYRQRYLVDDSLQVSVREYTIQVLKYEVAVSGMHGKQREETRLGSSMYNEQYLRSISLLARDHSRTHVGVNLIAGKLEKIIDLDKQVHVANDERTPIVVMSLLLVGSWVISFLIGMGILFFKKRYYIGPIIFISFMAFTVLAIQDMDNPHRGLIKPPYEVYKNLLHEIEAERS